MKSKDGKHLFELIKAMTKSEKRFFKISAQKHSKQNGSIYIKLFDAIEKQEDYDETLIKQQFQDESFVERLPMEKYNLYKILLRVLNDYNHEMTVDYKIYETLKSARILYSKLLYDQALKIIYSAKKIAQKFDKVTLLLELLELERACVNALSDPNIINKELPSIYQQSEDSIKEFARLNSYIGIFKDFLLESKNYFSVRNNKEKSRLQEIFIELINKTENDSGISFEEFFRKNNLLAFYFLALGDIENSYNHCKSIVERFEQDLELIYVYPERYFNTMYNLIMRCDLLRKKEESEHYYRHMLSVSDNTKIRESLPMSFVLFKLELYKVNRCIRYVEIDEGLELIIKVEKRLKDLNFDLNHETETLFYYNAAYLLMIGNEFKKALKYLNKVIHANSRNYRNDIFGYARIMNIILHYELNNIDLLPYAVRSTFRYLEKNNILNNVEKSVYRFMSKKLPKVLNEKEEDLLGAFECFKIELLEILKDPYENKSVEYFDLISWIDSKIYKKDFADIMREKATVL